MYFRMLSKTIVFRMCFSASPVKKALKKAHKLNTSAEYKGTYLQWSVTRKAENSPRTLAHTIMHTHSNTFMECHYMYNI